MPAIHLSCPSCSQKLSTEPGALRVRLQCPRCATEFLPIDVIPRQNTLPAIPAPRAGAAPKAGAGPAGAAPAAAAEGGGGIDFDFNLDLPAEKEETPSAPLDLSAISLDLGAPGEAAAAPDAHWQEVATKLDLAKAYQEMGDKDGARELLDEVLKEGDAAQQQQAQAMLAALG